MGEEHDEPAPFRFFTDHIDPSIAEATREGRKREFAGFTSFAAAEVPDPQAEETFAGSRISQITNMTISTPRISYVGMAGARLV